MIYTFISLVIIIFILCIINIFNRTSNVVLKEIPYFSIQHTNILKGLATILIIISHIANIKAFNILIPIGGVGVAIFLIISGYGLNESYKKNGLHHFFKKRILKITIPYWIMLILYLIINFKSLNLNYFFKSFFLINRLPFMWFVQYLLMWYLLFYLSKKYINKNVETIFLFVLCLLLIIVTKDTTLGEQSFSFTIGVLISKYRVLKEYLKINKLKKIVILLVVSSLFSIIFLLLKIANLDTIDNYILMNFIQSIMKVSLAFLTISFIQYSKKNLYNALHIIGLYSFEIYLSHTLILNMLRINNHFYLLILFFTLILILSFFIKKFSLLLYQIVTKKNFNN